MWRLGAVSQADGKEKESLDAYIASYHEGFIRRVKYWLLKRSTKKINGSVEGLGDNLSLNQNPL